LGVRSLENKKTQVGKKKSGGGLEKHQEEKRQQIIETVLQGRSLSQGVAFFRSLDNT